MTVGDDGEYMDEDLAQAIDHAMGGIFTKKRLAEAQVRQPPVEKRNERVLAVSGNVVQVKFGK